MIIVTLEDLCVGKGSYGIGASAIEYDSSLPTYLRITDIKDDGTLDLSAKKSVDDPEASNYMLKPGDIVFARTGNSTGRNYLYDERDGSFAYAGFLIKFSLDPNKVNPRYVKYYVQSKPYWDWVSSFNTGSTRGNINAKTYGKLPIMLPERKVQDAIALLCDSISDKIRTNAKQNDYLLQLARALFSDWFETYRHWAGVEPRSWSHCSLGDHVQIKRGGSPRPIQEFLSDEGYRWLKIADVTSEPSPFVLQIKEHIRKEGINKTVHLNAGSLVLSNSATPGIPKILDLDTCIHDGWLYFPASELSKEWLYLYFLSQRDQLASLANGSVFKNLKIDIVKNFDLVMPDVDALTAFQEIIQPVFDGMLNNAREIRRLSELRDALLPKLMSGEIDVSEIEIPTQPNNHLVES